MKLFFLLTLIFLASCKELNFGPEAREEEALRTAATGARVFDGDPEPKYPENGEDTLEGVDADKDGVRDDIEIWINETFQTPDQRRAWKQWARVSSEDLKFIDDRAKSIKHSNEVYLPSLHCLSFIYELDFEADTQWRKKFEARFYNTYDRIKAFDKSSANYNGQSGTNIPILMKHTTCKFEIDNLEGKKKRAYKTFME